MFGQVYVKAAEKMLVDDVADNKAIGSYGSALIQSQSKSPQKLSVLTHCNTGRFLSYIYTLNLIVYF